MAADVRWLGHASFHLSGGGADVLIDPWLTGNPKAAASADELPADVIALTHGHGDHIGDTVDIAKRTGAKVLAIVELAGEIEGDGVAGRRRLQLRRHGGALIGAGSRWSRPGTPRSRPRAPRTCPPGC